MPRGVWERTKRTHCRNGHPFDKIAADGAQRCSICDRETRRRYHARHEVQEQRRLRDYGRANPDKKRDQHLRRKYGITLESYRSMLAEQDGRCAACGVKASLVVDHCHRTGVVRALLCDRCNRMIGHAGENPEYLRRLADWLDTVVTDRR